MDRNGFLPAHDCKACGVPLQGDGSGHPAELYLGTYTGLCYTCERAPRVLLATSQLDGAEHWSYPPHCPAWRRDRETYVGYPDCPDCTSTPGSKWVRRANSLGGSYRTHCDACAARYYEHPERRRYDARIRRIAEITERTYSQQAVDIGIGVWANRGSKRKPIMVVDFAPGVDPDRARELAVELAGVVRSRAQHVREHWDRVSPGYARELARI